MADSSIENTLTQGKVAGVPVWAAGVGMAAVFIGFMWWRGRSVGGSMADGMPPSQEFPDVADVMPEGAGWGLPPGPIGEWLAQHPEFGGYPTGFSPRGLPSPITNVQWSRLVSDELLARGSDPTIVYNALTKYLAGQTLNAQEQAVINRALALIGAPPEGLIPVNPPPPTNPPPTNPPPTNPPPTQPPPPATDTRRYYTVTIPVSVKGAAKAIYGYDQWNGVTGRLYWANEWTIVSAARAAGWNKIYGDNNYANFPLPPGTKLVIP